MKPTLVILAAGMASRYGSMKQIQGFGPGGETIMDYSIFDAIRAGFGKVVFIIRSEFADDFREIFEPKLSGRIQSEYVFQEMDSFLDKSVEVTSRTKPWGTAHAVLCAKDVISEPFAVINADDFYGQDAFEKAFRFLSTECSPRLQALVGYELVKTLSEHGTVSRGVCRVDNNNVLLSIKERTKVSMQGGRIIDEGEGQRIEIPLDSKVSMNFWCFHPSIFGVIETEFGKFVDANKDNPKAEFFIPIVADEYSNSGLGQIRVIPTSSKWFGVTYKEDAPVVEENLNRLVEEGVYPDRLWAQMV